VSTVPRYSELPVRPDAPAGSSWGVWGPDDELGTLNLLTDERTRRATAAVRRGAVIGLNLPLEEPRPQLAWRAKPVHRILRVGHEARGNESGGVDDASGGFLDRDDVIDGLWLQGGTQWDGFAHVRHPEHGNYNGIADHEIHENEGGRLGIDRWARRGVVGRGVLVDLPRHYAARGIDYDPTSDHEITVADLRGALAAQGVEIEEGDILLFRTGWLEHLMAAPWEERSAMMDFAQQRSPGLEPSLEMVEYLWDLHIAAIAADNAALEVMRPTIDFFLHKHLIPLLGMPLGEYWKLDELAADCADDGVYAFLLISVPLHLRGGIGSPPQAVAIK
jgi:kynurenine formamidase